jgi:probable F420-dependent oxidoreductase
MKVYAGMDPRLNLTEVIGHARRVEALGYDGLHVAETIHDPFGVALLVAEHTSRITVRTSVALAFTRSPTLTAYAAWDLSKFSQGRFELGLGTQIRQNIEDRYGMPFSDDPVGQLRDYVGAVRAIFSAFRTGEQPSYGSRHYRISRMQPYFNPGPDDTTVTPAIYLGGVQRAACALAGEIADGLVTHPTNSNPPYLETTCRPALADGAARVDRDLQGDGFELVIGTQIIAGSSPEALQAERERQRRLLAFLYSTPAYRPTLQLYGWGDLGQQLQALVRNGQWDDLSSVLSDQVIDTLVPCGTFAELPELLCERFGGLGDGIVASPPADPEDDEAFAEVVAALQAAP